MGGTVLSLQVDECMAIYRQPWVAIYPILDQSTHYQAAS